MASPATAQRILDYWFGGAADGDAGALNAAFARWFTGGKRIDDEIRARFADDIETALAGGFQDWEDNVRARLALILLLDQFPRNVFRRSARAFAGDSRALELAQRTVAGQEDRSLAPVERVFLLMPYQHAEDAGVQRRGVELFELLAREEAPPAVKAVLESSLDYARKHRDIVTRFGRFPYRNEALGRETTAEEQAWLEQTNERFGQ